MSLMCPGPVSGRPGKRVGRVTLQSLVRESCLRSIGEKQWFYCDRPDCDVVYFSSEQDTISKGELTIRVGAKESLAPQTVCYCFDHTVQSIEAEIERTGKSTVLDSIAASVKAGECSCEHRNPKGACCLGDVRRVIDRASEQGDSPQACGATEGEDCCDQ